MRRGRAGARPAWLGASCEKVVLFVWGAPITPGATAGPNGTARSAKGRLHDLVDEALRRPPVGDVERLGAEAGDPLEVELAAAQPRRKLLGGLEDRARDAGPEVEVEAALALVGGVV